MRRMLWSDRPLQAARHQRGKKSPGLAVVAGHVSGHGLVVHWNRARRAVRPRSALPFRQRAVNGWTRDGPNAREEGARPGVLLPLEAFRAQRSDGTQTQVPLLWGGMAAQGAVAP